VDLLLPPPLQRPLPVPPLAVSQTPIPSPPPRFSLSKVSILSGCCCSRDDDGLCVALAEMRLL
jgi:hypothetical protein